MLYRRETARNDLKLARALFFIEDYKGANNRAYYSIFHAINAVHAVKGKSVRQKRFAMPAIMMIFISYQLKMRKNNWKLRGNWSNW